MIRLIDAGVGYLTGDHARPAGVTIAHPQWLYNLLLKHALSTVVHYAEGNVLDVGCGNKPWRDLFTVATYTGVDYLGPSATSEASENVDVAANAQKLPFRDGSFDAAVALRVLEHVCVPDMAVQELRRVLKSGGNIIVTTPFLYRVHDAEHDFHRWTANGLRDLLCRHGFEHVTVRPVGGPWAVLVTAVGVRAHMEMGNAGCVEGTAAKVGAYVWHYAIRPLLLPAYIANNIVGALLYRATPISADRESMPITYVVTARKRLK